MKKIAVTGAAGQIAYSLLFRIASGELFGKKEPVCLHLLETKEAIGALEGVKMELQDCAFPLLHGVITTTDPVKAFEEVDIAILVGAKPRGPGMERKDLLEENGNIFETQGKALNKSAKLDAKVFVVGNPCNTNCLIAMHHAPRLSPKNFFAMTRLDQNRASAFLAEKAGVAITDVTKMIIWGNHSSTQFPDYFHALIKNKPAIDAISDQEWLKKTFIEKVRKRGAEIIQARGKSSAASAAEAILGSIKDICEIPSEEWFSSGVLSDGNPYGIANGLIYSFPCMLKKEGIKIALLPSINEILLEAMKISEKELLEERDLIKNLLT